MASNSITVKLRKVRLSFPALFKPRAFSKKGADDGKEPKYSAAFILDKKKHAETIEEIETKIDEALDAQYGAGKYNKKKFKLCLRDGDEKDDVDGYGDHVMFITASSKKKVPLVYKDESGDLVPCEPDDGKLYGGCYVDASIRLWVQDNDWGKRVNAALRAVCHVKDGTPFGEPPVDPEAEFGDGEPEDEDKDAKSLL